MPYRPSSSTLSPVSPSATSPKNIPSNPNTNPFSALSPDLNHRPLQPMKRSFISYSRKALLAIARQGQLQPPPSMTPLEAWFGPTIHPTDPAIASMGPPARGGFGEGFGFGGGIGGRNVGRGGNRIGSRRQNDTQAEAMHGPMGRFVVKPNEKQETRVPFSERRPKREGEWRRPDSNRSYRNQPIHDDAEPAWMDDNEFFGHEDPAIAAVPDNDLVHFVPGKDMIAAHRKDRNDGQRRDGNKPFVSFFGADQQAERVKTPKAFNAADYLLPSRVPEERPEALEAPGAGFSSRFQKFFGAPPPDPPARPYQSSPNPPNPATESRAPERVDDHMARLMGLLSAKSPPAPVAPPIATPIVPPGFQQSPSYPPDLRQGFFPQEYQQYPSNPSGPPDALHLLNHAQYHPPSFPVPPPHHLLRDAQQPPHSERNIPHYQNAPSPYPYHHSPQHPQRPSPHLNTAQQDMLATLFSGLPRGPGP